MSIIYDALKKVQSEKTQDSHNANQPNETDIRPAENILKYKDKIIAAVIFSVLILVAARAISNRPKHKPVKTSYMVTENKSVITPAAPAAPASSLVKTILTEPAFLPRLALSGIVYSQDKRWALINNQLLSEGDTIKGVKILEIHQDEVVLDWKGEIALLKYLD